MIRSNYKTSNPPPRRPQIPASKISTSVVNSDGVYMQPEQLRAQLNQDFKYSGLSCRGVTKQEEKRHFASAFPLPRPVFVTKKDVETSKRYLYEQLHTTVRTGDSIHFLPASTSDDCVFTFALLNTEYLAVYKRNALTRDLASQPNLNPSSLRTPCLPDKKTGSEKITAMSNRKNWEVMPRMTSGKLQANGYYKHPRLWINSNRSIINNEFLTTGYSPDNIAALVVSSQNMAQNTGACLHSHHLCMQAMGLRNRPLAIYSAKKTNLDVFFPEEICSPENKPQFLLNEYRLHTALALSGAENMEGYTYAMEGLPVQQRVRAISSIPWTDEQLRLLDIPHHSQLREIVSSPDNYDPERVAQLCRQGARADIPYFSERHAVYLSDVLLNTESKSCQCERETTNKHEQNCLERARRAREVIEALIIAGCPALESLNLHYLCEFHPTFTDISIALDKLAFGRSLELVMMSLNRTSGQEPAYATLCERTIDHAVELADGEVQDVFVALLKDDITHGHLRHPDIYRCLLRRGESSLYIHLGITTALTSFYDDDPDSYEKLYGSMVIYKLIQSYVRTLNFWKNDLQTEAWQQKLQQEQTHIEELRARLPDNPRLEPNNQLAASLFSFLEPAYNQPLQFSGPVADNEETVLAVLEHYYRRPGHQSVTQSLLSAPPGIEKPNYSCSHALRVKNNIYWYMELLEKHGHCQFSADEKQLLSLAVLYLHAAVDETQNSQDMETARRDSAEFFRRDMLAGIAPSHNTALINQLAEAIAFRHLETTETLDERQRLFRHILHTGEQIDAVRSCTVDNTFPQSEDSDSTFHIDNLNIPASLSHQPAFMADLTAALHGSVDLACVTGGHPPNDNRQESPYIERHQLELEDQHLQRAFERTPYPVTRMDKMRDDNVRRTIAMRAGLAFCFDQSNPTCRPDLNTGICFGIHNSFHDLQQIRLPECMTTLEKMQIEHNWNLLSEPTRMALEAEIKRLQQQGIEMDLGTLSQTTLQSSNAAPKLLARGLRAESELRRRGNSSNGKPVYNRMYYTVATERASLDEQNRQRRKRVAEQTPAPTDQTSSQRSIGEMFRIVTNTLCGGSRQPGATT